MKNKKEVLQKFESLRSARLKTYKHKFLSVGSRNCCYNRLLRVKAQGVVGICQNSNIVARTKESLFVCSDETARKCRFYKCKNTCSDVEQSFNNILASPSLCGNKFPKLAILIWFLQDYESLPRITRLGYEIGLFFRSFFRILLFRWW